MRQYYKVSAFNDFRLVFQVENIPLCRLLEGAKATPFLAKVIEYAKTIHENITQTCSTIGAMNLLNVSFPNAPFLNLFPNGHYLLIVNGTDDYDSDMFNAMMTVVLTK
jgi:hypothetical protein